MKKLSVVALSLIAVAACAPPAAQDSAEIRALSGEWIAALNAGDVDTLVAMYSQDARVLPPNAELGQGHDAVRASFGGMIDAGLGGTLETLELLAAGDVGYHVGTYTLTAEGAEVDRGKFIEAWRRIDGEWKITNDIYNSDLPAAAGGPVLMATHEVKDAAHWLAAWQGPDSRAADFMANGATGVRVFQSPDDPKQVGLLVEVADLDMLMAWVASEDGSKAKAEDGVVEKTLRILTEVE